MNLFVFVFTFFFLLGRFFVLLCNRKLVGCDIKFDMRIIMNGFYCDLNWSNGYFGQFYRTIMSFVEIFLGVLSMHFIKMAILTDFLFIFLLVRRWFAREVYSVGTYSPAVCSPVICSVRDDQVLVKSRSCLVLFQRWPLALTSNNVRNPFVSMGFFGLRTVCFSAH